MKRHQVARWAAVAGVMVAGGGLLDHVTSIASAQAAGARTTMAPATSTKTAAAPPAVVTCTATAYVNDPDPKGTNVRSAPGAKSKVVATITDSDAALDITGSSGDWLRVRQVHSVDGKAMFKGEGWVFASLTAVRARGAALLRATPDASGVVVERLRDDEPLSLLSCRGDWLQVKHQTKSGWIGKNARCGNPVTTCV